MNSFFERRYVILGIFIVIILMLIGRLFYIQIVDDKYLAFAQNNVIRRFIKYPDRGAILDRHGKILVQNEHVYDILVIPKQVHEFDTLEFCRLLQIDKKGFDQRLQKAKIYSNFRPSIFEKQLSARLYNSFQEHLFEFPGFFVQPRSVRTYPDSVAAQFLGYISEVNDKIIEKSNGYYHPGDYIGFSGAEKAYESVLRGQRGVENLLVDSRNVPKGKYLNGRYDTAAVAGERLISSLDLRIQKLGEKLMQNKVGSIVAIEPSTGEILAFVSSPTYDPNELVGRERGNNISAMYKNPYNPLFIRPIQAYYPPGSSFKPLAALIALQEGIITPQTTFFCAGGYQAGSHWVGCTHHHGVTNLSYGIEGSCNTYFCNVFNKVISQPGYPNITASYLNWKNKVNKFGFGIKLDVDLPNEKRGFVPAPAWYNNRYGKNHWRANTIISLAIGQGELLATPLQMANIECTIANRGFYYRPHLIKSIGDKDVIKPEFKEKINVGIDSNYYEPVINGMQAVVERGTAAASRIPGIVMCGKTGTAQNPHGENHSVFVAFAPRDNPKIAIAVVVENAGQGASWAAPIASFIIEKYLKDTISRRPSGINPKKYMEANLLPPLPGSKPKPSYKYLPKDSLKKNQADSNKRNIKSDSGKKTIPKLALNIVNSKRKEDE
ncbi:penicillin-binding protein 2 [Mucilaginibacter arboris]|uniref:Penicillin-binding protein 2 n=1 Tax=Mucilaginibacter arboris TaxID=2682090 RepID=A0A7K1SWB2_9SPHI|nr:penicillin-binding protein 2 [Mucilaginibacter arboris]MVN21528.1 penicillin-binding protein 2 [Mucilaginibacter arboris]